MVIWLNQVVALAIQIPLSGSPQFEELFKFCDVIFIYHRTTIRANLLKFDLVTILCNCFRQRIIGYETIVIGKPGPFQVIDNDATGASDAPIQPPRRRYECSNYETCLNLAAALNWDSFTCRGCNGEVEESLFWRAHQMEKRDRLVGVICTLPSLRGKRKQLIEIKPRRKIVGE